MQWQDTCNESWKTAASGRLCVMRLPLPIRVSMNASAITNTPTRCTTDIQLFLIGIIMGLNELPSELIFHIIDILLSSHYPIPQNGWRSRQTSASSTRQVSCLASPNSSLHSNALNLLLTSCRMFLETERYLSNTPHIAILDLITVDKFWIWPTFRTIPARVHVLEQVEINFIPCCTEGERGLQESEGIRSVNQEEETMTFENLCNSIRDMVILCAVQALLNLGYKSENLPEIKLIPRIHTLVINIDTIRYGNGNSVFSEAEVPSRRIYGLAHLDFEKLYPVQIQSAYQHVRQMLNLMFATSDAQSWIPQIAQRIGNITYFVDGKLLQVNEHAARET